MSPHNLGENDLFFPCTSTICRYAGFNSPHVCFATTPLPGEGQWVYKVELPPNEIKRFSYRNLYRTEDVQHYAIPLGIAAELKREKTQFTEVTGRKWNEFMVSTLNEENRAWGLVWVSHPEVANISVVRQEHDPDITEVQVQLTDEFDPLKDYLIHETHWEVLNEYNKPREKWELNLLAGVMPRWAAFPTAWAGWVFDREVKQSAIDYILSKVPDVAFDIEYASRQQNKSNMARAWRIVGDKVGYLTGGDLGMLATHSWTAVNAIPQRIALRLGGWVPPKEKPEFEDPKTSGRILLANNFGVNPTKGPGVDESPVFTERLSNKRTYKSEVDPETPPKKDRGDEDFKDGKNYRSDANKLAV